MIDFELDLIAYNRSSQHILMTTHSHTNPVVFVDLHANKQKLGRVTFELYADKCPKAAENYR